MKILNIAYYTILRNFRDRRSLSLTLLFPIMLILILGTALNSAYAPDKISKINIAYLSADKGEISKQFDMFLKEDAIKDLLEVKTVSDYKEGAKLVDDKKVAAFIYLPDNVSVSTATGKKDLIKVYQSKANLLNTTIVQNLIDSFTNGANTMETLYKMGYYAKGYSVHKNIEENSITTKGTTPRAIDYYAVTMLALTLMYGALYGSFGMSEDKDEKTIIRIKSSPTKPYVNYIGKTLGLVFTLLLQAIILILFTKYAYHANWGSDFVTVFAASAIFSVFATAFGIMCYTLTNDSMKASGLINILVVVFTFISGGYAKINADGTLFEKISYISPNKLFQTAMFNTVYGGSANQTHLCLIALGALAILMFAIGTFAGRRELI